MRKTAGLAKDDEVVLSIVTEDLQDVVNTFKDSIAQKVGAVELVLNGEAHEHVSEEKIRGKSFTISLAKK